MLVGPLLFIYSSAMMCKRERSWSADGEHATSSGMDGGDVSVAAEKDSQLQKRYQVRRIDVLIPM